MEPDALHTEELVHDAAVLHRVQSCDSSRGDVVIEQPGLRHPLVEETSFVNFAVVDVETTGLNPRETRMIEIAIVEIDQRGRKIDEFESLLSIPGEGPLGAEFIHHVQRDMLQGAPVFAEIAAQVADMLKGRIVVGHVIAFDLGYIAEEFRRAGFELPALDGATLCTRELARAVLPPGPKSLQACCDALGIDNEAAHTALGDARATADVLTKLLGRHGLTDLSELSHSAAAILWPTPSSTQRPLAKVRERFEDQV